MHQAPRPGISLPWPPHTSAVLRERLPQTWACPQSRARVRSVLPAPHCPLSPLCSLAFFPWALACRAACFAVASRAVVGVEAGPEYTPGGPSTTCARAARSAWELSGRSCPWGWSPEVQGADLLCVLGHKPPSSGDPGPLRLAGVTLWAFPRGACGRASGGALSPFQAPPFSCRLGWGEPCSLGCT